VEVPFVTIRRQPRSPAEASPGVALLQTLRGTRKMKTLWLSLDDLDYVEGDALSMMKSAMEEAQQPTVVLAVAGGPELRQRLVSEHSPIIRFFSGSDFDLGNFTLEETREALELPVRANRFDTSWTEGAVREVHRWTAGYPYLVQCLAFTSFREGLIGASDVEAVVERALALAGTWMEQEISHASDQDIRAFDKLATAGRAEWRSAALTQLGISPIYVGRLVRLGVLRKVARGHYVVVKPPMIARYHMWRRNLEP
ncbi:MAG: type IV toxin-antitoxin system AbiEi family antitoxin domain-containing protein, partial [Thermoplasmata archaeon]